MKKLVSVVSRLDRVWRRLIATGVVASVIAGAFWWLMPPVSWNRTVDDEVDAVVEFDYGQNHGIKVIGQGDFQFETQWSKASDWSIHQYERRNVQIALYGLADSIDALGNVRPFLEENRSERITPEVGEVVILRNTDGNYAAIKILDIKDRGRNGAAEDRLTLEVVFSGSGVF